MSRMKRSQKKLLHEPDEFLSLSQRAWLWLHENRDRAALFGGAVAAVVLVVIGVKAYVERSHGQRAAAVSTAVAKYVQAGGAAPAELRQELGTLADRYRGSVQGSVARFFQAGALGAAGDVDQARRIFTELASGSASGDIGVLSRVALAYLELARGGADTALTAFQELLKVQGAAVPRAQIMAEIAGIHEKQGRAADARRAYQELIAEYPEGSWAAAAKQRLRLLTERGASAS